MSSSSQILFCCYAIEDEKKVEIIYAKLKNKAFSPWMAPKDLLGGVHWPTEIERAIDNCTLFLAFISKKSVSKTGEVMRELRKALDMQMKKPHGEIFLIPIRLEEVKVPDLSVGLIKLREFQWIDYFKPDGHEKLINSIKQKLIVEEATFVQKKRKVVLPHSKIPSEVSYSSIGIGLIGDKGVGKTSLRRRFMKQGFEPLYYPTIGADFTSKKVALTSGKQIRLQMWDLAGAEHFSIVRKNYYKTIVGALAIYDVTHRESFEKLESWISELWKNNTLGPCPIVILANKVDLSEMIAVDPSEGKEFAESLQQQSNKYGVKIDFFLTSAKTDENITVAINRLVNLIEEYLEDSKQ